MSNTLRKVARVPESASDPATELDGPVPDNVSLATPARVLTSNERIVYDALRAANGPLKAYALLDVLKEHGLRAPMTIYRALDGLIERGLAKKIISLNAFIAVDQGTPTCGFVICRHCGAVDVLTLKTTDVARMLGQAPQDLDETFIEVYSECLGNVCEEGGTTRNSKGAQE